MKLQHHNIPSPQQRLSSLWEWVVTRRKCQPQPSDTGEPVMPYMELGSCFSLCQKKKTPHHTQSRIPNEIVIFLSECWAYSEHSCAAVGYKNTVAWWGFSAVRFHQVQSASSPIWGAVRGGWLFLAGIIITMRSTVLAWPLQRWKIEVSESRAAHSKRLSCLKLKLGVLVREHDETSHSSGIKDLQAVLLLP